jgi:cytochrome c oxidase subunit 4
MASEALTRPGEHGPAEGGHEQAHASNQTYVIIAVILAIITAVEVAVWYLPSIRGILVPALIILSVAKFLLVVGYFMHLKYDNPLFRFMFFFGLIVALSVYLTVLALFWTSQYYAPVPTVPGG